jgi:hypothetical protein
MSAAAGSVFICRCPSIGWRGLHGKFGTGYLLPGRLLRANERSSTIVNAFARGYLAGWQECFQVCKEAMEEELGRWGIN